MTHLKTRLLLTTVVATVVATLAATSVMAMDYYVGLEAGYGIGNATKDSQARGTTGITSGGDGFIANNFSNTSISDGSGVILGGGFGMVFNSNLSIDVNVNYRDSKLEFKNDFSDPGNEILHAESPTVSSLVIMPKVHYGVPLGSGFRVGGFAGIGLAVNRTRDMTLQYRLGTESQYGKRISDLAFTLGAEGSYELGLGTSLTFSAGYTSLGKAEWSESVDWNSRTGQAYSFIFSRSDQVALEAVDLVVGLRYGF